MVFTIPSPVFTLYLVSGIRVHKQFGVAFMVVCGINVLDQFLLPGSIEYAELQRIEQYAFLLRSGQPSAASTPSP